MVGRALNVDVFLCDDLYMSNARVTYVCEYLLFSTYILIFISEGVGGGGKRTMKEISCHQFP